MPSLNAMAKEAKNRKSSTLPKKATKKAAPPADLSTEFVQESDLEADEKSQEVSSSDDEESLPENPAVAVLKSKGNIAAAAADSSSSSGSESESSEDSNSDDDDDEKPSRTAKKVSRAPETAK
jgi:hypothetical protein